MHTVQLSGDDDIEEEEDDDTAVVRFKFNCSSSCVQLPLGSGSILTSLRLFVGVFSSSNGDL